MLGRLFDRLTNESQSFYLVGLVVVNGLVSIVTIPMFARGLSITDLGVFSVISSLAFFFQMLIEGGFNTLGPQKLAICSNEQSEREVIAHTTQCKLILTLLLLNFAIPVHFYFGQKLGRPLESLIILFTSLITAFNPNWVLISQKKCKFLFTSNTLIRLIYVVVVAIFFKNGLSLSTLCLIQFFVASAGVLISYVSICKGSYAWLFRLKSMKYLDYIKASMLLFMGNASDVLLYGIAPSILAKMAGAQQVAYLYVIDKLRLLTTDVIGMIVRRVMSDVFKAEASKSAEQWPKNLPTQKYLIALIITTGIIISCGLILSTDLILNLVGEKYAVARIGIKIFSIFPLALAGAAVAMLFGLLSKNHLKEYASISILSTTLGLIFILVSSKRMGYVSVVLSWIFVQFFRMTASRMTVFFLQRHEGSKIWEV